MMYAMKWIEIDIDSFWTSDIHIDFQNSQEHI